MNIRIPAFAAMASLAAMSAKVEAAYAQNDAPQVMTIQRQRLNLGGLSSLKHVARFTPAMPLVANGRIPTRSQRRSRRRAGWARSR